MNNIVLGGGCFWCLDAVYRQVKGVTASICGYAGGATTNPDYYAVCGGQTGHAEVVKVTFDPTIITERQILEIFWAIHNPTTLNQQGADIGSQYRSILLYKDDDQKNSMEQSLKGAQSLWNDPIVTEVTTLDTFYPAEAVHQNYFDTHPEQAYCQVVINPKLGKVRESFKLLLKE